MDWFDEMAAALASGTTEIELTDIELPVHVRDEILDLARIASHDSGERINAPLLCYALGIAVGRGATLEALAQIVRSRTKA
ncbi:MAG: DUF6457 domain-containing protein [Actinomycetota bacterium]